MLERYKFEDVPDPQGDSCAFTAEVKYGCICGPAFESEGQRWQPVNPSCVVHTLTADRKYIAEFRYGRNSRTVGVLHGRGGSRNSF